MGRGRMTTMAEESNYELEHDLYVDFPASESALNAGETYSFEVHGGPTFEQAKNAVTAALNDIGMSVEAFVDNEWHDNPDPGFDGSYSLTVQT